MGTENSRIAIAQTVLRNTNDNAFNGHIYGKSTSNQVCEHYVHCICSSFVIAFDKELRLGGLICVDIIHIGGLICLRYIHYY